MFGAGAAAEDVPTVCLSAQQVASGITLAQIAVESGLASSKTDARRLAAAGGLRLEGAAVASADVTLPSGPGPWLLSAGRKRHARIVLG